MILAIQSFHMMRLGKRNFDTDMAQCGVGPHGEGKITEIIGFIKGLSAIVNKFRKPKNSADLAEIKTSLQAISLQLQQIKNMLTEIMNMINELGIKQAFQEDERVISDSLLDYNRMMNMTTKAAHHQARQSFIANGNKVFESVKHLLQGLKGELSLLGDILQFIVNSKQVRMFLLNGFTVTNLFVSFVVSSAVGKGICG